MRSPAKPPRFLTKAGRSIPAAGKNDDRYGCCARSPPALSACLLALARGQGDYAAQAFGVYQDPAQYGEVIWRFAPEAAARAAEFRFHPKQIVEPQNDGALIVRFHASGWLEMAWHLYQWGNKVEVLAPEGLRALVAGHQRPDFEALP